MPDSGLFAVARRQDCIQNLQRANALFGRDGVGQLIQRTLLGRQHHGFYVAERDTVFGAGVEHELLQFVGDHHHVAAQRVDQFAGSVGIDLYWDVAAGAIVGNPANCFALLHARQFDDAAVLAHGFADALVAFLILHLHAANVGGNADVVGDEDDQRVGIRILQYSSIAASFSSFDPRPKRFFTPRTKNT